MTICQCYRKDRKSSIGYITHLVLLLSSGAALLSLNTRLLWTSSFPVLLLSMVLLSWELLSWGLRLSWMALYHLPLVLLELLYMYILLLEFSFKQYTSFFKT